MKKVGLVLGFSILMACIIMMVPLKVAKASCDDIAMLNCDSLARYIPDKKDLKISGRGESATYYYPFNYRFLNGSVTQVVLQCKFYSEILYTPNGTDVAMPSGNNPTTYLVIKYLNDLPTDVKNDIIARNSSDYNLIQTNGIPTTSYNCHSFAWYCQDTSTNDTWINFPTAYYTDLSYESVNSPRIGDIICYYYNNGTQTEEDDINLHSGIVVGLSGESSNGNCGDANMYIVKSKWGMGGLYTHKGDECPYTYNHGGTASYVKYYRPRTNEAFNLTNPSSNTTQTIQRNYLVPQNSNQINNYVMYELNIEHQKDYEFELSSNYELDVRLYNGHMQLINAYQNIAYENGIYTYNIVQEISPGTYYLRVAYDDPNDYGTITTSIINEHEHYYHDHYTWKSYTQHKAYCICGAYANRPHVTPSNAFQNGEQYAECIECHGLASVGIIYRRGQNRYLFTSNGSLLLPNGVIVLADEDYEAYMSDALVFINPNDNIDRGNTFISCLIRKEDNYWINTLQ